MSRDNEKGITSQTWDEVYNKVDELDFNEGEEIESLDVYDVTDLREVNESQQVFDYPVPNASKEDAMSSINFLRSDSMEEDDR